MRDTQQLIIDAATAEFAEHGFHGARTERVAHGAGVNKQLIFYYFDSKAGLHAAVVAAAADALRVALGLHSDGRGWSSEDGIRRVVERIFGVGTDHAQLVRLVIQALDADALAAQTAESLLGSLRAGLSRAISDGQGMGYYRDDIDPDLVAAQAVTLILGFFVLNRSTAAGPAEARTRWIAATADWITRSLSW